MIPIMNYLKVQCSVVGNHEFDFGPKVLQKFVLSLPQLNNLKSK